MTREEFTKTVIDLIQDYIDNAGSFDSNPQLRVNPATLKIMLVKGQDMLAEIEDSNEAVEDAAGAEGSASEDASDFQVRQNPDFYAVKKMVKVNGNTVVPDITAVNALADIYLQ